MAKKIKLTKGKYAIVDDDDFGRVSKYKWYYHDAGYASALENGKTIYMHRFINNTPDDMLTDHISGNRLDNRKCNLRSCTFTENNRNQTARKRKKVEVKGVSIQRTKGYKYYRAEIKFERKEVKTFPFTEDGKLQAARWYNEMALRHFGEFAKLNEV